MIKLQGKIPKQVYLGFSGGVDSMACFDFLSNRHEVSLVYVNHGDAAAETELPFVEKIANKYNSKLFVFDKTMQIPQGESKEHFWSNNRKEVFNRLDAPVVVCHHLNDCMETWAVSSLQGKPRLIPYSTGNIIRPFRLNPKSEFINWCKRRELEWCEDATNSDPNFSQRNFVRNVLMPNILKVNPGYALTVKKLLENDC